MPSGDPLLAGVHHRVVLLPDATREDIEAALARDLPGLLDAVAARVNGVFDAGLSGTGALLVLRGGRLAFEVAAPELLERLPAAVGVELVCALAVVVPSTPFDGPWRRSLQAGLARFADQLTEAGLERARARVAQSQADAARRGPLHRLKDSDRALVEAATGALPVLGPQDVDAVDALWAEIHGAAPWLQGATVEGWRSMREAVARGQGAWMPLLLLNGAPGRGKTTLGRELARGLGVPLIEIDAGAGAAAFQLAGLERGWGGSEPGLPVETILRTRVANPVILINETCRIGAGTRSERGTRSSLSDALLGLLDRGSCVRWRCPALRIDLDLSRVNWVLTANTIETIDAALLSRVRVVTVAPPTAAQVGDIVRRRLGDLDDALAEQAAALIAGAWTRQGLTLRHVEALCTRVRRSLERPQLH